MTRRAQRSGILLGRSVRSRMVGIGALVALAAIVLSQDPAASLAESPDDAFVAPPRAVSDLTRLLDQVKPDPQAIAARQAIADEKPAADMAGNRLAEFLHRRGEARRDLGRIPEALADFREAVRLGRENNEVVTTMFAYVRELANAEESHGNLRTALQLRQDRLSWTPPARQDLQIASLHAISQSQIVLGDLQGAGETIARFKPMVERSRSWPDADLYFSERQREIEYSQGLLAEKRGLLAEAEQAFRRGLAVAATSVENYPNIKKTPLTPSLSFYVGARESMRIALARVLASEGKFAEGEALGRDALVRALQDLGSGSLRAAYAAFALAEILGEENRQADAERLATAAVAIFLKAGIASKDWTVIGARAAVARYQERQGKNKEAMAIYDAIRADIGDDAAGYARYLGDNVNYAFTLLAAGRREQVFGILNTAVDNRSRVFGATHRATAEIVGLRGVALTIDRQYEAALRDYQAAVPILLSTPVAEGASNRNRILRAVLSGYLRALSEIRGTPLEKRAGDAGAEGFRLADVVRGQSVQLAVARASTRMQIGDPELADLARREQDAGQRVTALEATFVNAVSTAPDQQDPKAIDDLQTEIHRLDQARTALRGEIERRFPTYSALLNPKAPTIEQARATLRPGEALFTSYSLENRTLLWAIPKDGTPAFAAVPIGAREMADMVSTLRRSLDPDAQSLTDIPRFDVALAHKLYAALLEPVASGWQGAKVLMVASDVLAELPPGVLVTQAVAQPTEHAGGASFADYKSVPFLVRDVALTQLPSVATLTSLRAVPPGSASRRSFVGFGDPWFSRQQATEAQHDGEAQVEALETRGVLHLRAAPATLKLPSATLSALPRLPDTAVEVRQVASALGADPQKDVFLGAAANERQVRTMRLDDRKIVLFATHGLVPGDLDGLTQPALALSAPQVAGGEGDGLLTMGKILGLKLDADWVVLSACNTASGQGAGAEAVSGLGRAFFYAGARALLVTNWPVETTSARRLTADIFRRQAADPSLTRAQALRAAELSLIDGPGRVDAQERTLYSYAHPIFWAPFSLVGDGGGAQAKN